MSCGAATRSAYEERENHAERCKDASENIKAIRPDFKVIFTSGYSVDIIRRLGIEFISKPVSPNELLRRVRKVLDTGGSARG